jgi:hypothetical protein
MTPTTLLCLCALTGPTAIYLLSKCFFLAPWRVGWLMMFANVVYETLNKKFHWSRWTMDAVGLALLVAGWAWLWGPWAGLAAGAVLGFAWAYTLLIDVHWRTDELAHQDRRFGLAAAPRQIPMPIPQLILNVRGPVLQRGRILDLGAWPEGHEDCFDLLILNPSIIVPQWPLKVAFAVSGDGLAVVDDPSGEMKAPEPGEFVVLPFRLRAGRAGTAGEIRVTVTHGDMILRETMRVRRVLAKAEARVVGAEIRRWKGGARAGFGWRGDQDLYDPSTFQSADGLRLALGLSRQFRLPSTLYLSGRLSLEPEALREFGEHFGFDRRPEDIPGFIEFLRHEVTLAAQLEFPFATSCPLAMELGNHMYLHYGTHAAVDPGNGWQWRAEMGAGRYPWQGTETDSFSEQRDNAARNVEVIREKIGVAIQSWGVPGRANDADTSRALEATGMVVASDSDAPAWTNVMKLMPPHHPKGCTHLVEISKKYPGDCSNAYKVAMIKYWLHAARRTGRVFLYMAHHHLLMHEGTSCYQLTRAFFHYALSACHGDLYAATVTSLGLYWERVLCPQHKWVRVSVKDNAVTVENTGTEALDRLPLEIEVAGGRRYMTLVDVPPGASVVVG